MSRSHFLVPIFFGLLLVALVNNAGGEEETAVGSDESDVPRIEAEGDSLEAKSGTTEEMREETDGTRDNSYGGTTEQLGEETGSPMQSGSSTPSSKYDVQTEVGHTSEAPHSVEVVGLSTSTSSAETSKPTAGVYSMDPTEPTMPTVHTMEPTVPSTPSTPTTTVATTSKAPIVATTTKPKSGSSALASSGIILCIMVILLRTV